jgi:integrase
VAAQRANIRRRGKSWAVYFRVNGKQHWRSFADRAYGSSLAAREAAELYLAQSQVKIKQGAFTQPSKIRFDDFAQEWLRDYARVNVRERTFETYEAALRNHLIPHFGQLYLTQVTRKSIDAFVADWSTGGPAYQERWRLARDLEVKLARDERRDPRSIRMGRAAGTISNALTPLREMLGHAVEWGYLASNPAAGVRRPRAEHREMQILDLEQIRALLNGFDENGEPFMPREWRALFLCAVTTGVRLGELLALRWGDIDWQNNRLWVRRSITRRGAFQEPKTRSSIRAIAMTATLSSTLRQHRMESSFSRDDELVFCTGKGTPLDGVNLVRRVFKPALRRAKLPEIRFHDLRHSFASLLIAQGEHPKLISDQLGHASVKITMDRYGHLMDQSYGDASDRLDAALFGVTPPKAATA